MKPCISVAASWLALGGAAHAHSDLLSLLVPFAPGDAPQEKAPAAAEVQAQELKTPHAPVPRASVAPVAAIHLP